MGNLVAQYGSQILSFLVGLAGGSLITFSLTKKQVSGNGSIVDQTKAKAGGDIVGGNKR
jgi:uncharacterized protein YneF (UPF0154 family)